MRELARECLTELGEALKMFGTYAFDDKGAYEVMELEPLRAKLRALSVGEAAEVLLEVARSTEYEKRGERLASDLLGGLEDWDELFEIEGIDEYY